MDDAEFARRLETALGDARKEGGGGFLRLASLYRNGTPARREAVRAAWNPAHGWKLPSLVDFPLRNPLPHRERVAAHLLYGSIENLRMDYRDTLIGLCAAYHIALKVALDPSKLFREAAAVSLPEYAELLAGFLRRDPRDRTLAAFGWKDESSPERIRLRG
jgi:hypothetical protein